MKKLFLFLVLVLLVASASAAVSTTTGIHATLGNATNETTPIPTTVPTTVPTTYYHYSGSGGGGGGGGYSYITPTAVPTTVVTTVPTTNEILKSTNSVVTQVPVETPGPTRVQASGSTPEKPLITETQNFTEQVYINPVLAAPFNFDLLIYIVIAVIIAAVIAFFWIRYKQKIDEEEDYWQ